MNKNSKAHRIFHKSQRSTELHWKRYWSNPDSGELSRPFNPVLVDRLEFRLEGTAGKRILEAGCGLAVDTIELSRRGAEVVGFDYTLAALCLARSSAAREKINIGTGLGNVLRLPFKNMSFDAVFHAGLLEHFRNPEEVLKEQRRVLKQGGILLVDVPQTYNLYTVYKTSRMLRGTWFAGWETQFTIRNLESLLRSVGFEIIDAYGYGYYPPILRKFRWMSSVGKGWFGHPLMPPSLANLYDKLWQKVEGTRAFLYFAQSIGVIGRAIAD